MSRLLAIKGLLAAIVLGPAVVLADTQSKCEKMAASAEVDDCVSERFLSSNLILEEAFKALEKRAESNYLADEHLGAELLKLIAKEQEAWVAYRDLHCRMIAFEIEAGSAAYLTTTRDCAVELNEERTRLLEKLLP